MNDGGPAFPQPLHTAPNGEITAPWDGWGWGGMTLRDYFAAQALQGLLAGGAATSTLFTAVRAYKFADAMLEARASKKNPIAPESDVAVQS